MWAELFKTFGRFVDSVTTKTTLTITRTTTIILTGTVVLSYAEATEFHCRMCTAPLFRILEAPVSNIGLETEYHDPGFSWLSSVPTGISSQVRSRPFHCHILANSLLTNHSSNRCYLIRTTGRISKWIISRQINKQDLYCKLDSCKKPKEHCPFGTPDACRFMP
jgi:hypothetical protein